MRMSMRSLMKAANKIAKLIYDATEDYGVAMSFALKEVWRQAKRYNKKYFGKMAIFNAAYRIDKADRQNNGIPSWFLLENCSEQERYVMSCADSISVVRETAKAQDFKFYSVDFGANYLWVPKSILA